VKGNTVGKHLVYVKDWIQEKRQGDVYIFVCNWIFSIMFVWL